MKLRLLITGLLIVLPIIGVAQDNVKDLERLKIAAERSRKATEVLKLVAALPEDKGIPKQIREKMNLIGVIPDAFQLSLLFSKGVRGHGVSALKQNSSWSMPSFYFFGKGNGLDLTSIGSKRFDIVMVLVNADFRSKKEKDRDKTDGKKDPPKPESYFYAFADGTLKPIAQKSGIVSALLGAQTNVLFDDKLNKAAYGANGNEVLLGKLDPAKTITPELTAFRNTLEQLYPTNGND